jgi:hypothetical protein
MRFATGEATRYPVVAVVDGNVNAIVVDSVLVAVE